MINAFGNSFIGGGGRGAYFDGVNDHLSLLEPATDGLNGTSFIFSCWIRPAALPSGSVVHHIFSMTGGTGGVGGAEVWYDSAGAVTVNAKGGLFSGVFDRVLVTSGAVLSVGSTHHILFSCDTTSAATRHFLIDDADASPTWTTYNNDSNIIFNQRDVFVARENEGATKPRANASLANLFFAPLQYDDVATNKRNYITASGTPADLGADGSTPTGVAPYIYLNGSGNNFALNSGTKADFTLTGNLTPFRGSLAI